MSLLEIENLSLTIGGWPILKGVDLTIAPGEVMGLVGESGSGKSMTALTIMQLLPESARASGRVHFAGTDILAADERRMCELRGDDIGMVFQEPMTALNPVKTIGEQVAEGIRWHTGANRADAERRAKQILERVGLPEQKFPLSRYPHELSGGQRQRVVIAIACALKPKLLIADEPTTALDVVLQAQILELLRELVDENRMGLLLISHDLAVVADMADRITILRHGEVMEAGETARTLSQQRHPYTRQLAEASMHVPVARRGPSPLRGGWPAEGWPGGVGAATRDLSSPLEGEVPPKAAEGVLPAGTAMTALNAAATTPPGFDDFAARSHLSHPPLKGEGALLQLTAVSRHYPGRRLSLFRRDAATRAVDDVSFSLAAGQSVALVGRSGCGKSTLARMILALEKPTSGAIRFRGEPITGRTQAELKPARRDMQVVFQDPYGSFDPRHRVERLVAEPLHLLDAKPSASERRDMVAASLREVHLSPDDMHKYPHEFSGGQRQRISIARALITRPKLIVADEPVSALDVSIRAQILDLFAELNQRLGVAYLFITHDLTVARAITDDVMVMHEGRIVESGRTTDVLDNPRSDAAKMLVAAAPDLRRALAKRLARQS